MTTAENHSERNACRPISIVHGALLSALIVAASGVNASALTPITGSGTTSTESYSVVDSPYLQDFDTLPSDGTFTWVDGTTFTGWFAKPAAGELETTGYALDPSSNARDLTLSSVGELNGGDRALTYHTRVDVSPTYLGLGFVNQTGTELSSFTLDFDAEQWKEGTNNRTVTLEVEYRIGAEQADLNSEEGWTALPAMTIDTLDGAAPQSTALASGPVEVAVPAGSSFWFRWITSNSASSSTSSHDTLAIDNVSATFSAAATEEAPSFALQPTGQIVAVGETATFSVEANGYPVPTFQWFHGPEEVEGATSATLTLSDVQLDQAGDYSCVATNSEGSATSDPASLTVSATPLPPVVTVDPVDMSGDAGASLTLSVSATGSGSLSYSWTRNGEVVAGANGPDLTFDPLTADDAGEYVVTVTNSAGNDVSEPAQVSVHLPPSIETPPTAQTVAGGAATTLSVVASGKDPLEYVWFKDGEPIEGETGASLELSGVGATDVGAYSVTVSNELGSESSAAAQFTVTVPPGIAEQPQTQSALVGGTAVFSVEAVGSGPFTYQWFKEGAALGDETAATLTLIGVSETDAVAYSVEVTNPYGTTASDEAGLSVTEGLPASAFNLTGFGEATTGGGVIPETDPAYVKVSTPLEFATALANKDDEIRVIEILNDLDLGYHEVGDAVRELGIFREHSAPRLHPVLIESGVSRIDIKEKSNLTIFSANGASIRHASLNIKRCNNIILRNLKFDELWEWDEDSKGDYDGNDWDFITLGDSGTVWDIWIDHCTFTKAYDGVCDIKGGSYNITFSWCHYAGDDGATNPNSFVRKQLQALEANRGSHQMYDFLRSNGFSIDDIAAVLQGPAKGHLIGANTLSSENSDHKVTFHHQWYENPGDRLPRLRAGNVHNYNIYVDCETARQAKIMRDDRVAAMDPDDAGKLSASGQYNFNVFLNGSISTEDGAVLVEKSFYKDCLTPLRNNQTDPSDPAYTGKILGLDCITRMTDDAGVSTTVRGDSTDPGNPMGPIQAPVKPFSWNLPGGELPYSYPMDDPAELPDMVVAGAGAGLLEWEKENWLKTSYAGLAPTINGGLEGASVAPGETFTFSVGVVGDPPFTYVWKKDGEVISGANGPSLVIDEATADDAGTYSVTVSNSTGSDESSAVLGVGGLNDDELFSYALGTDPATGRTLFPTISNVDGLAMLSFQRLRDDIDYFVDVTEDLKAWELIATNPGNVGEWVDVIDTGGAGRPRRFLRLRLAAIQP